MASVIGVGPWMTGEGRNRRERRGGSGRRGESSRKAIDRTGESDGVVRMLAALDLAANEDDAMSSLVSSEEIAAFAPLAVTLEAHDLLTRVEAFMTRGLTPERIFVELLAPAARYLGEEWTADRIDFLDVTMGLWRLQEVLREVASRSPQGLSPGCGRRVLFSPVPGDQHSFGAAMIDECFARGGWNTDLLIEPSRGMLLARVASTDFDLVGLTVSCDCHIGQLASLIVAVRNVSSNPHVRLLLGGRVLIEDPDLARRVGADGTASSALDALDLAERLIAVPRSAVFA